MKQELNIDFSSDEEMYFAWYLEELKENGFVKFWEYEKKLFHLAQPVFYEYKEIKISPKKKIRTEKIKNKVLLEGATYTPDFTIHWTQKAEGIFYGNNIEHDLKKFPFVVTYPEKDYSIIEVKPIRERFNMKRLARQNQKWVFDKFKEYVQIVVPQQLFEKSFTPERFLLTNKSFKIRTIHFKVKNLKAFLNN